MQASIEDNKQEMKSNKQKSNERMMNLTEESKAMLAAIMDQINTLKYSPTKKDSPRPLDPITVVPDSRRDPPLYSRKSTKIGGMWNLKHEISSQKLYELLIKV